MTGGDVAFSGSIPALYDRFLGPLLFAPYGENLVGRLSGLKTGTLLETAAGTGIVTEVLARRLPADVGIVATDLNQAMVDHAATKPGLSRVALRQADALALPFEAASFDAVACQFGAMFFPDKIQGYREARRVLRPGGRFLFNVWDGISQNEFADTVTEALAALFPHDPPRFMARTPHGYHDVERIREELSAAGFADISVDAVEGRSKAASPRDAAFAYCQGTPLRTEIEARDASRLEDATNRATEALVRRFGNGAIEGRIRAFVIAAIH